MDDTVELLVDAHAELGEGPVWDPRDGSLLWTDIVRGEVHRLSPQTGMDTATAYGQPVGNRSVPWPCASPAIRSWPFETGTRTSTRPAAGWNSSRRSRRMIRASG